MLAIDAVEVYTDRRDLTNDAGTGGPDGRPDLITDALRGTGTIICNVQRYNPTEAQLAASVAGTFACRRRRATIRSRRTAIRCSPCRSRAPSGPTRSRTACR